MSTTFNYFDNSREAFINPKDKINDIHDFPEICISTFSKKMIDSFAQKNNAEQITHIITSSGNIPIFKINYKGKDIAFYMSRMGAPACVSGFEDIVALGAKKFVLFGSCGVLNKDVDGKIIIPSIAVRDEGTSYHYIEKSDEIKMDATNITKMEGVLNRFNLDYVIGKTWTTDAVYRETIGNIERRKKNGCISVEMECSSMLAVSQFRNISFAQYLYTADDMTGKLWNARDLQSYGEGSGDLYMSLAMEMGLLI